MQNSSLARVSAVLVATLSLVPTAQASAVLPQGESYAHLAVYNQSFDTFLPGGNVSGNPGGEEIERNQFRVSADWGLGKGLGVDLSLAYFDTSSASFGPFTQGSQSGIADSYVGLRYALTSADQGGFASTLRLGLTIPGDYSTGQLSAPGDDAFGTDLRYAFRFDVGTLTVESFLGYWLNEGAVPESFGYGVTLKHGLGGGFWIEGGYRSLNGSGSLDIGGAGFTPARLPFVTEDSDQWELAVGFGDSGKRYYRVGYSEVFDGRNVGEEKTWGVSVAFPF